MAVHPIQRSPYSWRDDPDVPRFDDTRVLAVMDGACALCSATAQRLARWDRQDRLRITTAQSPLGRGLLRHFGMSADNPESWLVLKDGHAFGGLDAMIALYPALTPAWRSVTLLKALPKPLRDWLYMRVARNRYALFGRGDLCALPVPELRRRLV